MVLALVAPLSILEKSVVLAKVASGMEMVEALAFSNIPLAFSTLLKSGLTEINCGSGGILEHIVSIFGIFEGGIAKVDGF